MTMHRRLSLISRSISPHTPPVFSVLLLLSLCLVLLLPSSLAIPIYSDRPNSSSTRRSTPRSSNASPPVPSPPTDAPTELTPHARSHSQRVRPNPLTSLDTLSDPLAALSEAADVASPAARPAFAPGARAVDDPDHNHAPVEAPSRIRAQPQQGGLYAQQRPVRSKHVHNSAEDVPIANSDAQQQQQQAQPISTGSESCLSAEQLADAKKEVRTRLLSVMDQYLAVWQAEEKTDDEIEQLYNQKKDELKVKLADKKQQLAARACPDVRTEGGSGRRLLGLEDDDWFDQEEERVYLIDESNAAGAETDDSLLMVDDNTVGAVARIVAGGKPSAVESEDDEAPHFDASIHPYSMPSAFTSLSERDIQAIHSPPPTPQPKPQPVLPAVDHDAVGEIGFVASIIPTRYSPAPLDNTPVIVVGQRSQRDMDEDLEEERRKRRERLKAIRARSVSPSDASDLSQPVAAGAQPLSDEQLPPGGFVASISPMAPQRATPEYEEEQRAGTYVGSVSAPAIKAGSSNAGRGGISVEERWRREAAEEQKAEEGGGVWRSGSRGRLERAAGRSRQD